jgi:hypothetical protein
MSKVQGPLFSEVAFSQVDKTITLKPTERLLTPEQLNIVIARTLDFGHWTLDSAEILDSFLVFALLFKQLRQPFAFDYVQPS